MDTKKYQKLKVKRKRIKIVGDTSRVITRPHIPDDRHRISKIIQRIMTCRTQRPKIFLPNNADFSGGTKTSGTFLSGI
jgi:hypothetical protein